MLGDKIKKLRKEKGITQQGLADLLTVAKSTIGMWENNKRTPDTSMIVKIADYFDITVDYLLNDVKRESAIQKFGFCYSTDEIHEQKATSRNKIGFGDLSDDEMISEAINIYKALFSRSLRGSGYSLQHVNFNDYCAMMLNQNQRNIYGKLSDEKFAWLKNKLIEKFGCKEGISEGTNYNVPSQITTNKPHQTVSNDDIKFALFDGSDGVTDAMYDEVKQFAAMVKMRENAKRKEK